MDLVSLAAACALHASALMVPRDSHCGDSPAKAVTVLARAPGPSNAHLPRWESFVGEAALRFDVPPSWIRRVIKFESGGNTILHGRPITSPAGAMGLMQLMPGTYDDMRRTYHLGSDPFDPHDNILAGTAYLRAMFDRFGSGVFAAYNAGPQRYQDYLHGRQLLPSETISYVAKVNGPELATPTDFAMSVFTVPSSGLFFALSSERASPTYEKNLLDGAAGSQPRRSSRSPKNNLFAPLSSTDR